MNRLVKEAKISLILTVVAMAISSLSLMFIPFTPGIDEGQDNYLPYAIAAAFWLGLVLAFVTAQMTKVSLHRWRERLALRGYIKKQKVPGIFYFSWNIRNAIIYLITAVGLVLIISDIAFGFVPEKIMFPIISITLLSFMLHCVFDGQYYKVYKKIKESMDDETKH